MGCFSEAWPVFYAFAGMGIEKTGHGG